MQIVKQTNINFMKYKWVWIGISTVLNLASLTFFFTVGIKQGVEFTGGANVTLRFSQPPQIDQVRSKLLGAKLEGVAVTTIGDPGNNELSIRVGLPEESLRGKVDLARLVADALTSTENRQKAASGMIDLNVADQVAVALQLKAEGGVDAATADAAATALSSYRREHGGIYKDVNEAIAVPGLSDAVKSYLSKKAFTGEFGLRGQDVIEGTVAKEIRNKAVVVTLIAMACMLFYIWARFRFQWGLGAIVALVHDVVFTLGCFAVAGYEADLPVVAAFLTLVGFSMNDTVVVYDRIRENIKNRGEGNFEQIINDSINQMLSRTLITSLTVWLCVVSLFLLAGPVLRSFSFVMLIGVIVGTYSSIYIAAPILVVWKKVFDRNQVSKKAGRATAKGANA